jgi:hypothetical protein
MKKFSFKKFAASPLGEKLLFAVYLVCGAFLTDLALDRELWRRPTLHIMIFICALFFDILLIRLLHKMLRRKVIPTLKTVARKAFSSLYKRIGRLAAKLPGSSRGGKVFVVGKEERSFAMETRERKSVKRGKKLPRLAADASEREKARHAYTVFVFKRDKDIPSVLTPSEVAVQLDPKGEHREIFENYNFARYSKEEKEIRP